MRGLPEHEEVEMDSEELKGVELPTADDAERTAIVSRLAASRAFEAGDMAADELAQVAQIDATLALVARLRDGVSCFGDTSGRI